VALPMGGSASDKPRQRVRVLDALMLVRMDQIADAMANGCPSISEAARRLGLTQSRTDQLWQRIRRDLGAQAV
jgi:hypothetical protein